MQSNVVLQARESKSVQAETGGAQLSDVGLLPST